MLKAELILSALILSVFSLQSQAATEKYSCTTHVETGNTDQFDVVEGKPGGNLSFGCLIQTEKSGKKVLDCKQLVLSEENPANPIHIVVDYGSDLRFEGQYGMLPDLWDGYIWPRNSSLTCVFSK